jgi:hypothetical protein
VDLAVELEAREADFDRLRAQNEERVEQLYLLGHLPTILEREFCWYLETFRFLKGRIRGIALADYKVEKSFVLAVPHRVLIGEPEELQADGDSKLQRSEVRRRRPPGHPF